MIVFESDSPHTLYRRQLQCLMRDGQEIEVLDHVTGQKTPTKELLDVATVIREPRRRVHIVPGRRANPWLALSESLWLLAGRNDVAALEPYNSHIRNFSDDRHTLYDAYGYRVKDQVPDLIARLEADPSDRRAVLTIWTPKDLTAITKSPPCNDVVAFKLREGCLHMTIFCRSNDIHWGLYAVNLCQFSVLQEYIAWRLRAGMGWQTHVSNSLHVYLEGPAAKVTKRMMKRLSEPLPIVAEPALLFGAYLDPPSHEEFVNLCSEALERPISSRIPFLEFTSDFLMHYRKRHKNLRMCRWAEVFQDWVQAGEDFQRKKASV